MTREEQILQAARNYVSGVMLSSPSDVIHFGYGAKWADEHPNLESLWHDASEEPKGDNWKILCLTDYNECWVDSSSNALFIYNTWHEYVDIEAVKMWAYLNDLLPKDMKNV